MPTSQPVTCPNCGQNDQTNLAAKTGISVPPQPSATAVTFLKAIRWIFGIAYGLAVVMLLVVVGGGFLLGGFTALFGAQYDPYGTAAAIFGVALVPLLCSGFLLVFVLALMGGFMLGLPWLIYRGVNQNYQQRNVQWQRAMSKYQKLYHCSRCAGVFLEGQNRIVPIEQMQAFLHEFQTQPPATPYGV